jgi:hypothetical protein
MSRLSPVVALPLPRGPLLALLLAACQDYNLENKGDIDGGPGDDPNDTASGDGGDTGPAGACDPGAWPAEDRGVNDICDTAPPGGFTPITEWSYGSGQGCLSQPIVADLDQDGVPEVIFNLLANFFNPPGYLTVLRGDTGALVWQDTAARLAYGSPPAVGDIDGDGEPEIVVVREYATSLFATGDYTAAAYEADGTRLWESAHFVGLDFDWASAPVLRDMDHDGFAEVVVGRVILNGADGSTRGRGAHGRGSYGIVSLGGFTVSESSVPAVADLDLDGVDEVIVGNAMYSPDGATLWTDPRQEDGMISVANLDGDPEGEFVAISYNTIRAVDTDGTVIWGPTEIAGANILATAGIADLDQDGSPEIVTAGGNQLVVLHADGSVFWTAPVQDESGATGASFFDFEGDGVLEVVYIDELDMQVFDGLTGAVKFYNPDHGSNTMFDYPTVADVDADDQAEIVVCHNSFGAAVSVFGDLDQSWRPARKVWNQHAYDITNINDDLSIPATPTPGFQAHNTWHSAIPADLGAIGFDLGAEILEVCTDDCDAGTLLLTVRLVNTAPEDLAAPVKLAVYGDFGGELRPVYTQSYEAGLPSGQASAGVLLELDAGLLAGATGLQVRVDDDGTGTGAYVECSEENNLVTWTGELCPG